MGAYRDPRTGQLIFAPEKFDTERGVDTNREKAIAKGLSPVQVFLTPDLKRKIIAPDTSENIAKARAKGLKLPHEVQEGQAGTGFTTGTVTRDEVQQLANSAGVPFEQVDKYIEMTGANPDYRERNKAAASLWTVSRAAGMNIPNFLVREAQDPKTQQAISDLQQLANERRSWAQAIAENVGQMAVPIPGGGTVGAGSAVGRGLSTAKAVGVGAGIGGVQSLASSVEGEEGTAFLVGAGLGGGLGLLASRLTKGGSVRPASSEEAARARELATQAAKEIEQTQGKTVQGLVTAAREANQDVLSVRKEYVTGLLKPTEELLERHGAAIESRPEYAKTMEKLVGMGPHTPDTLKQVRREVASIDLDVEAVRVAEAMGFTGKRAVSPSRLAAKPEKFASTVTKAKKFLLSEANKPNGVEAVAAAFERITDERIVKNVVLKQLKNRAPETHWQLKHLAESLIDGKYVSRGIDRRLGTNVEGVVMNMDDATNKLTILMSEADTRLANLEKAAKAANLDVSQMRKYVENPAGLDEAQQKVVAEIGTFFEDMRQGAVELGLDIKQRPNYFFHTTPNLAETVSRVKQRAATASEQIGFDLLAKEVDDAGLQAAFAKLQASDPDLIQAVKLLNRRAQDYNDGQKFMVGLKKALNPSGAAPELEYTDAAALYTREDAIPDFLLVDNLRTAGLNWVQQTYRHALMREHMTELTRVRNLAEAAGDKRAATYLTGVLQDLAGLRPNTLASLARGVKTTTRIWADDAVLQALRNPTTANRFRAAGAKAVINAQQVWPTMLSMAYPNFLGLSPRAALLNLSQLATMTVPDLGNTLSARYAAVSADALKATMGMGSFVVENPSIARQLGLKIGDTFSPSSPKQAVNLMSLYLENKGFKSEPWSQDLVNALHSDIQRGVGRAAFEKVSNAYSRTAMLAFSATETVNRYTAAKIGERLAKDILAGDSEAMQWVLRIAGPGVKNAILQAARKQDAVGLERVVQQYIISKTILNYTRQSMSNFGRFMGPMFSMFTKWPSTVTGEVVEAYTTQGLKGGTLEVGKRYIAPWAVLAVAGAAAMNAAEESGQESRLRGITGSRGLSSWAPIQSMEAIVGGEFLKSPAADIYQAWVGTLTNPTDLQKWERSLNESIMTFAPGMSVFRFLIDDWTRLVENEEPEDGRFKPASALLKAFDVELPKKEKSK
jgi:hypothetical protein